MLTLQMFLNTPPHKAKKNYHSHTKKTDGEITICFHRIACLHVMHQVIQHNGIVKYINP